MRAYVERNFVNLASPKPEDVERAKKFIDSQIPTKTTADLDKIFAKKPPRKKRPSDFLKRIGFTPAELGTIMSWAKEFNKHNHAAEILRKVSR